MTTTGTQLVRKRSITLDYNPYDHPRKPFTVLDGTRDLRKFASAPIAFVFMLELRDNDESVHIDFESVAHCFAAHMIETGIGIPAPDNAELLHAVDYYFGYYGAIDVPYWWPSDDSDA